MASAAGKEATGSGSSGPVVGGGGASSTSASTSNSGAGQTVPPNHMENVKVAVRLRPFTAKERQRNCKRCVEIEQNTVALYSPKHDEHVKKFTFDHSYWSHDGFKRSPEGLNLPDPEHPNSSKYVGQERVFADLGRFLLDNALQGYNSALLAYGQTGSGKSYTVSGYGKNEGILPRFARELFAELDGRLLCEALDLTGTSEEAGAGTGAEDGQDKGARSGGEKEGEEEKEGGGEAERGATRNRYEVCFSMLEIYNEVVRDLLAKGNGYLQNTGAGSNAGLARRGLRVREHPKRGFFVENLTSIVCANKEEIERLIEEGQLNKSIAATSMNETSSRGHTIYEFHIKQFRHCIKREPPASEPGGGGSESPEPTQAHKATNKAQQAKADRAHCETLTTSVVQLVDLAGSERMAVHLIGGGAGSQLVAEAAPGLSRAASPLPGRSESSRRPGAGVKRAPNSANSSSSSGQQQPAGASAVSTSLRRPGREAGAGQHLALASNHQQRFKESVSINQSLSALGNCIQVLSQFSQQQASASTPAGQQQQPKIPYRDSVLTKLLNKCCLSGNSKVVLIATLSPAHTNYEDTLSTLRFADRAKQIRTHATVNRMSRGEIVNALQRENERLKQILDGRVTRSDDSSQTSNFDDTENVQDNFNGPKVAAAASPSGAGSKSAADGGSRNRTPTPATTGGASRGRTSTRQAGGNSKSGARAGKKAASSVREAPVGKGQTGASKVAPAALKNKRNLSKSTTRLTPAGAPIGREQMEQLVSSAATKAPGALGAEGTAAAAEAVRKSRSLGQGSSPETGDRQPTEAELELVSGLLEDIELNDELINNLDDDNLLSPDSDDSFALTNDERLTDEEKIAILNKLLGNSNVANKMAAAAAAAASSSTDAGGKLTRPKKAGAKQHIVAKSTGLDDDLNRVTAISSSLKRSNPYLTNLNPDEQLTGMISYIIKPGETIVGKSQAKCDLLIYGPELRARHAKFTRLDCAPAAEGETQDEQKGATHKPQGPREVFLEPIWEASEATGQAGEEERAAGKEPGGSPGKQKVALFVNGEPVLQRTRLNHCDRILFGSNAYFVFIDTAAKEAPASSEPNGAERSNKSAAGDTLADPDLVTYDMAHNEVLRKIMSDAQNEAMIKEINDYTHRPGTGKHRKQESTGEGEQASGESAAGAAKASSKTKRAPAEASKMSQVQGSRLSRSMTIHGDEPAESETAAGQVASEPASRHHLDKIKEEEERNSRLKQQQQDPMDEVYRKRLMEDTYEFAMPVAEANAIAKEMGIKVTYGLKILTGEEQLLAAPDGAGGGLSPATIDEGYEAGPASADEAADSSEPTEADKRQQPGSSEEEAAVVVSRNSIDPDSLDVPPQLYVHVHLEEANLDFYWTKEKFQERRVKMLELYGAWDVGGKPGLVEYLIEQSKYQGYYMIDPFVDDIPTSLVLVGHAQVSLRPVSHMSELRETFDILDVNDDIVGSIHIEATACHPEEQPDKAAMPYKVLSKQELASSFVEQPRDKLLGRKFVFLFKIVACSSIPDRYARIMCQYTLARSKEVVRTPVLLNHGDFDDASQPGAAAQTSNDGAATGLDSQVEAGNAFVEGEANAFMATNGTSANHANHPIAFNHSHFVVIDQMNEEVLGFLQHGFLTIQVVGQYKLVLSQQGDTRAGQQQNRPATTATSSASSTASSSVLQPTLISTIISGINKYRFRMEQRQGAAQPNNQAPNGQQQQQQQQQQQHSTNPGNGNYPTSVYANSLTDSAKSNRIASSGIMNSNSGASSITSASATINLFDQQNDDEEGTNSLNGISQDNIIDMILTKRKLDRAENQLHYLKRTINIAEHYNKKNIPIKTVKKLLSSYGQELEGGSLEEMAADVTTEGKSTTNKQSGCVIQ